MVHLWGNNKNLMAIIFEVHSIKVISGVTELLQSIMMISRITKLLQGVVVISGVTGRDKGGGSDSKEFEEHLLIQN